MAAVRNKGSGLEWFVRRGSAVRGPFSSARVRHFVLEGKLELDDEVSPDKAAWQRLGSVAEVVPLQMRTGEPPLSGGDAGHEEAKSGAGRPIAIALAVIVILTLAVYFAGQPEPGDVRDCAAPPAPGLFLEACHLSGVDLRGADLKGARLANTVLSGSILAEADLSDADARYADLSGADLSYARLNGVVFKGANLRSTDLTNADLRGADLSFADLGGAQVGGARFDGATLNGTIWTDGRACDQASCPR